MKRSNHSRTGLRVAHLREALADRRWHSLGEITATVSDRITPEGALRRVALIGLNPATCGVARAKAYVVRQHLDRLCRTLVNQEGRRSPPQLERRERAGVMEYRLVRLPGEPPKTPEIS